MRTAEVDDLMTALNSISDRTALTLGCCEECTRAIAEGIIAAGFRKQAPPAEIATGRSSQDADCERCKRHDPRDRIDHGHLEFCGEGPKGEPCDRLVIGGHCPEHGRVGP